MFRPNQNDQFTFEAGADLRDKQFYGVKKDANGRVILASAKGERILGVLQNKPNTGEEAQVVLNPAGSPVVAGAAITVDTEIIVGADGRFIPKDAANQYVAGISEQAATAAGQVIDANLTLYQASN